MYYNFMLSLFAFLFCALGAAGQDEPISDTPCGSAGYDLPAKLIAWASAEDADVETAERKAVLMARDELSRSLSTLVEAVTEMYTASEDKNGDATDARSGFYSVQRSLADETLRGAEIICREVEPTDDGNHRVYISMAVDPDFFAKRCVAVVVATDSLSTGASRGTAEERIRRMLEAE